MNRYKMIGKDSVSKEHYTYGKVYTSTNTYKEVKIEEEVILCDSCGYTAVSHPRWILAPRRPKYFNKETT